MEEDRTERFLRLMNEQNARIAQQDAAAQPQGVGIDPVREAIDAKRREKYGRLRAREKPGKRTTRVRNFFG